MTTQESAPNTSKEHTIPKVCEIKSPFCSGELVALYTFKKRRGDPETPPVFWCCGPCRIIGLRTVAKRLVQVSEQPK